MKKCALTALLALVCMSLQAIVTVPIKGTVVSASDPHILYAGRISFTNPERPAFNFPGIQIRAAFEGTSLRMIAKPKSGYFMAQIDNAEPFKVSFMGERDSVVTLATALPEGTHQVRLMYAIEGYEMYPEFWGFVLDKGKKLVDAPAFPDRKIEFIGNSITCGYGNEGLKKEEGFDYATAYQIFLKENGDSIVNPEPPVVEEHNLLYIAEGQRFSKTKTNMLPISLQNEDAILGFQLDVVLPEGMTLAKNEKGKNIVTINGDRTETHTLSTRVLDDGSIRIVGTSMDNDALYGNDGELLELGINIASWVDNGEYAIQLKDVKLTNAELAYYLEVTNRVSQKLLRIAG